MTAPSFARQLAEYRRDAQQPPTKRFRSSAAPKGTKLPSGYQDRAQQRQTQDGDAGDGGSSSSSDAGTIEQRVAALEELVKEGKIDQATFDKLRGELGVGGDVKSTHMVKGLDWDLLRRVKAGEDVSKQESPEAEDEPEPEPEFEPEPEEEVDMDAEFERVTEEKGQEKIEPTAAATTEKKKKGTMAPPPPQKKSRNEILKELKASRAAAAAETAETASPAPQESVLGSKFKKLSDTTKPEKKRWVEQDENGRRKEILAITDAQGNTKRKTRWLDKPGEPTGLLMPAKDAKPLGMDVPMNMTAGASAKADEDEDDDIFEGVGADYNPLAGLDEGSDDSDDSDGSSLSAAAATKQKEKEKQEKPTEPSASTSTEPSRPRNYFSTRNEPAVEEDQARVNPLAHDPSLLAAFKRAAALRQADEEKDNQGDKDDNHGQRFLEEMRRREAQDAMDMDMGFGGSRVEDDEEEEPVVLEGDGPSRAGNKRKRGPKKRKGDKDNVSDVMKVMEARK